MKILFVSHEKKRNGSTVSLVTLLKELRKENIDIDVEAVIPGHGSAEDSLRSENIPYRILKSCGNFTHIGDIKIIKWICGEFINLIAVRRLCSYAKKNRFDFIVSNSTATDVGARAARMAKIPHVYYVREFMEEDHGFTYTNQHRMKKLLEGSEKMIFISQAVARKYLAKYNIADYKVMFNGIEPDNYFIGNHAILMNHAIEIIQVGSISEGKCSMESVKAIQSVRDRISCHLTLLGNGTEKYMREINDYIEQNRLQQYVSIIPYSTNVREYMEKADILLMNSRMEGFGRVTVEGMLGGLLAVGRNSAGTAEIINSENIGCLFSDNDELCSILCDVDADREKYRKIAAQGQKSALERFSPSLCVKNFMEYIGQSWD